MHSGVIQGSRLIQQPDALSLLENFKVKVTDVSITVCEKAILETGKAIKGELGHFNQIVPLMLIRVFSFCH